MTFALLLASFLVQCKKETAVQPVTNINEAAKDTTKTVDTFSAVDGRLFIESAMYPLAGRMGPKNGASMTTNEACTDNPHSGSKCISIAFDGSESWCGIVMFASTPWKDQIGKDLKGFKKLTFWTRCNDLALKNGQIHMGMKFYNKGFNGQFFYYKSTEWQKMTVYLPSTIDTVPVNYLFEFSQNLPVAGSVIYIDDLQYEK